MSGQAERRVSRRAVLRRAAGALGAAASAAVLGGGLAGCGPPGRGLQVAVVWSGHELSLFRQVLRGYPEPVEVISAGDDIDALVRARQRAGTSPDVAIVPRPGLIRGYVQRGWASALPLGVSSRFPAAWTEVLRVGRDGRVYGAWVKAAHKSLFWYLPSLLDEDPPGTWDELVGYVGRQAARSGPAPLAVGGADGWALTDWLDNLVAALVPDGVVADLAVGRPRWDHPAIRDAFGELARVWSIPGAFPGGGRQALVTQFDASVMQVTSGEAVMLCQADFVSGFAEGFPPDRPDQGLARFPFPAVDGYRPLVLGGDAAVVLHGSAAGRDLVEWLTRPGSFRPWLEAGGYLAPHQDVEPDDYPPGPMRELAADLRRPRARFDLSDRLVGTASGRDGVGSWLVLQDFFADVTAPSPDVGAAIDRAVRRLNEALVSARADLGGEPADA